MFLDVDGVLHSCMARTQAELFKPECMHRLKQIIDATGAKLVLSSAWRKTGKARNTVKGELSKYGITSFFDCTRDGGNEYARHTDIQDWLSKNSTRNYVALDDLPMFQLKEHYVGTTPERGLTDREAAQAIRILNQ